MASDIAFEAIIQIGISDTIDLGSSILDFLGDLLSGIEINF